MRRLILFLVLFAGFASSVAGQGLTGPSLGVASRFGQAWHPGILARAQAVPVFDFRDEIFWERVERNEGVFGFSQAMTNFPDAMARTRATASIILNPRHPQYDRGETVFSPGAATAFGRFSAAIVSRFPSVTSVEVGNEFNGPDFVSGPVLAQGLAARPAHYLQLLRAVHSAVRHARPDVRILGGAVLGIPDGYLGRLFGLGAGEFMDALAIHPYTTPAEHLRKQISVLRRIPAIATMPIEVTEFGSTDPALAAGKLLKGYCQFALSGVTRVVWYPLASRGDGLVPILKRDGTLTNVGRAYRLVQSNLVGQPVLDQSPDPYTYACRFGRGTMIIWGEPRSLRVDAGVMVFGPSGQLLQGPEFQLSMKQPIVLKSDNTLEIGRNIHIGRQHILADSYHDLAYPVTPGTYAPGDRFQRFTRRDGREIPLVSIKGQSGPGMPWTPFLSDPGDGYIRLTETHLRPDGTQARPIEVVHRYVADRDRTIAVSGWFDPSPASADGVRVRLKSGDDVVFNRIVLRKTKIDNLVLKVSKGEAVEISVGPNGNADGDLTRFRITVMDRSD